MDISGANPLARYRHSSVWRAAATVSVLVCVAGGCSRSGDPLVKQAVPDVINAVDSDLTHGHRHQHKRGQKHGHDHGQFDGAHAHVHDHRHRHNDPPHGGQLIDIAHHQHGKSRSNWHLEVMPIQTNRFVLYPLRATKDQFGPLKIDPESVELRVTPSRSNESGRRNAIEAELTWDTQSRALLGTIPNSIEGTQDFDAELTFRTADSLTGTVRFQLSRTPRYASE